MSESIDVRILLPADKDAVSAFARTRLTEIDEMEREMASWTARWRPESLDHYLPQGWSFGAFDDAGRVIGYLLGQPLLFHRGLTQTLWVEEVAFADARVAHALLDVAYRWARDKHLQCVLLEGQTDLQFIVHEWQSAHRIETPLVEVRTAKF